MADNYMVVQIPAQHDSVIECDKKTELIMLLREVYKEAAKRELPINFSDKYITSTFVTFLTS